MQVRASLLPFHILGFLHPDFGWFILVSLRAPVVGFDNGSRWLADCGVTAPLSGVCQAVCYACDFLLLAFAESVTAPALSLGRVGVGFAWLVDIAGSIGGDGWCCCCDCSAIICFCTC